MAGSEGSDALKFLGQKIGPLPAGVWLLIFAGLYWYMQRRSSSATAASGSAQSGYGTDPAGNAGYIDPQTGYVYGSAEDIAALQQQGTLASNTYAAGSSSSGGSGTAAGGYQTDAAWSEAAVNYLVARGVDPATANQAIQLYMSGQNLTAEQQGDVNLAIQGIGSPPQLPGPSAANPVPIQAPGSATSHATAPPGSTTPASPTAGKPATPSGVSASRVTATGFALGWHPVAGATAYRVRVTYQGRLVKQQTARGTSAVISGLTPDHTYTVHVAAQTAAGLSAETNGPSVKTAR